MKRRVVITSKFNIMTGERNKSYSRTEELRLQKEWIFDRMDIFMRFTAQCLMDQTDQSFVAIYAYLDETEELIKAALEQYPQLPDNIQFVKKSDYMKALDEATEGYDILMLSRLDSDDLYHTEFVEKLMDFEFDDEIEEILCQSGYIYNSTTNRLAEYFHEQFTFYTFIYRLGEGDNRYSSFSLSPMDLLVNFSHFSTLNYKYKLLQGRNFMFNIHKKNTSSKFVDYNTGFCRVEKFIDKPQEIEEILFEFF